MPREKGHCQADFPAPPSHIHIWLAASSLSGWHQVPDTLSRAKTTNLCLPPNASKYFHSPTVPPDSETSLPRLHWLPAPILRAPRTPRGTPAEWAPPPTGCLWLGWAPELILPKPQGGSDNRRKRRRGLVRWASDLSPNRFQSLLFYLFVKRTAREGRSSQRLFCHSSAAGDTRGRRPQTPPGCARRHRSRQMHRRGSPTLSTAAGWEAQETPGSRWNPPAPGPHPRVLSGTGQGAPMPARVGGSPKSPGERLPRCRGKQSVQVTRGHSVCSDPEP